MKNFRHAVIAAIMTLAGVHPFSASATENESTNDAAISSISEIILPEFQASTIAKEGAVIDTLMTDNTLWMITKKILWKWNFLDRRVQKIVLLQKTDSDNLIKMGSDGLNLYVAFTSGVYQFAIKQGKVFKYPMPQAAPLKNADFFGFGDSFWLVANDQISRIDRYGKTIVPQAKLPRHASNAAIGFDPSNGLYWYAEKNVLYKINISDEGKAEKILQLKHPIKTIVAKNDGAIITTSRTVFITDNSGKRVQTIPVEKSRKIVSVSNTENLHAYVFNDQILETFDLKTQSVGRFLLPFDASTGISGLKVNSGLVHMIADGKARLFSVPDVSKSSK